MSIVGLSADDFLLVAMDVVFWVPVNHRVHATVTMESMVDTSVMDITMVSSLIVSPLIMDTSVVNITMDGISMVHSLMMGSTVMVSSMMERFMMESFMMIWLIMVKHMMCLATPIDCLILTSLTCPVVVTVLIVGCMVGVPMRQHMGGIPRCMVDLWSSVHHMSE